jgi:hypothetical protein
MTNKQEEQKEMYVTPTIEERAIFMEQVLMASTEVEGTGTGDAGMQEDTNDGDIDWPLFSN